MHEHGVFEDCVKGPVRKVQVTRVAFLDGHVGESARFLACLLHAFGIDVDPDYLAWGHSLGKACGDSAWSAAHVEEPHTRDEIGEKKGSFSRGDPALVPVLHRGVSACSGGACRRRFNHNEPSNSEFAPR
jgi:hypothetical protein